VTLESTNGAPIPPPAGADLTAVMDQQDRQFVPHVLAVEVGTTVNFPNSDAIRHDVYSFSPAKTFELPLYAGPSANPVVFDKPGVVVLGCNIHDWMLGFIAVVPTPYFAQTTDAGVAAIEHVPPGDYHLSVWAPRIKGHGHGKGRSVTVGAAGFSARFDVALAPERAHAHRRPEQKGAGILNQLKRKFSRFRQAPPH
jgi:plastocyanin